jgi:guanylate kinase
MRKGEVAGVDYFFVNIEKFNAMLKSGDFIESALVHDNYYGTSYASIDTLLAQGNDVILDIDVQGMHTLKSENKYDLVTIFIMPPDLDTLASRLQTRGTDSGKVINQRLINAENEINAATDYDYLITNDDLDRAVSDLLSIITAERLRYFRRNSL